jgi:hypothetical protein
MRHLVDPATLGASDAPCLRDRDKTKVWRYAAKDVQGKAKEGAKPNGYGFLQELDSALQKRVLPEIVGEVVVG